MITTERIAEIRAILDADLLDQGTAFYMACDDLPSALDTIEAQQRRIEELEAALKRLGSRDPFRVFNDEISARIKFAKYALQPKEPTS